MKGRLLTSLLAALTMHQGMAKNPVPTLADVSYGTHERQKLDFYKAASQSPTPLLFFIHGGGWMSGDKSGDIPLAQQCLDNGISVVSSDDPPVYLYYDSPATNRPLPADPVHSAMFGAGLAEKLKAQSVPFEFNYRGATVAHPDIFGFLAEHLGAKSPSPAAADPASNFPFFDISTKVSSIETGHATASVVDAAGKPVLAITFEAGTEFPFVKFPGRWDLSASPGVKTEITNSGTSPVKVAVRVDNTTHPEDSQEYNSEVAMLGPGETSTLEVTFGKSYGSPGFTLDPTRVESISILAVSPAEPATLQIRSLTPSASAKGENKN